MKTFILSLALFLPAFAHARNPCDGEAIDCARAHTSFNCGGDVSSSVQTAADLYEVTVVLQCPNGITQASVQVKFDGLACTCTSVVTPGDGG